MNDTVTLTRGQFLKILEKLLLQSFTYQSQELNLLKLLCPNMEEISGYNCSINYKLLAVLKTKRDHLRCNHK